MQVRFCIFREIKIDDDVDCLDIDASSEQIGADEVSADALAEIVEDAVSMSLEHLGVRVEAGISAFGDSFCEEFDSIC